MRISDWSSDVGSSDLEVTQMMGGLAYMTGPPGRPLRAGSSVVDITGGMFGVIAILAALERRHRTGKGAEVKCALYETRSEERRVGKECVRPCRSRWSPHN